MSSVSLNTEIRTRYNSWATKPQTAYPNESFTPNPNTIFARLTIVGGEEQRMDIGGGQGNRTYRVPGVIGVQLFAPLNKGNNEVLVKADEIATIFRNWCGSTVNCGAASISEIGPDGEGHYQCNITIPFHSDYQA
jgi:hypothetical protein